MGWLLSFALIGCLAVTLAEAAPAARPVRFYVAPDGSDAWSGRRAGANAGRTDGPFATVLRARDAVRELKRRQGGRLEQPVIVSLRGGTHRLSEPLVFTPEDAGTETCPIAYTAYRGEKPIPTR